MIFPSIYNLNATKLLANQSSDIEFKIIVVFDVGLGQQKPFCTISYFHKFSKNVNFFLIPNNYAITTMRNITDDFTPNKSTCCIRIYF